MRIAAFALHTIQWKRLQYHFCFANCHRNAATDGNPSPLTLHIFVRAKAWLPYRCRGRATLGDITQGCFYVRGTFFFIKRKLDMFESFSK